MIWRGKAEPHPTLPKSSFGFTATARWNRNSRRNNAATVLILNPMQRCNWSDYMREEKTTLSQGFIDQQRTHLEQIRE
jgi:hypothetical protein